MKIFVKNINDCQAVLNVMFKQAEKTFNDPQETIIRHQQKEVPVRCILTGSKVKIIVWSYKKPGTVNWAVSTRADILKHIQTYFKWASVPKP